MAQPQQSPRCHLPAVMHLLPLVHKWETRLPVAQTKFKTEQSKGLLFSLVKKSSASAMLLLAGDANSPGLLLEQNFALWFGKARGDPAPSKFNGLSHRCCFHACQPFSTRCEREDSKRPPLQDEEPTAQLCKQSWADLPWSWHMQSRLRSRRV